MRRAELPLMGETLGDPFRWVLLGAQVAAKVLVERDDPDRLRRERDHAATTGALRGQLDRRFLVDFQCADTAGTSAGRPELEKRHQGIADQA